MKRLLAILLIFALCCPLCALAETPAPIPVLSESEIPPTPEGMRHYLILCADSWNANINNLGFTDGIMMVTVDENSGRVMLTSFIRDMLIWRPDEQFGRINYVARTFGVDALVKVINTHFGLRIDHVILVDFGQVQKIVDAVGGVDLTVTSAEAAYLKRYAISSSSTTPSMGGAGTYHFTGHAAVIYMRIRRVAVGGVSGDFMRTQRARTVISQIADSLANISYEQAQKLLDVIVENTRYTDMTISDLVEALDTAFSLRGTKLEQIRMPVDGTYEPMPYSGMATQQIDYVKNREALHTFLFDNFIVTE